MRKRLSLVSRLGLILLITPAQSCAELCKSLAIRELLNGTLAPSQVQDNGDDGPF